MSITERIVATTLVALFGLVGEPLAPPTETVEVSLSPDVSVSNATPMQLTRLKEALARFRSAGMLLPDLEIEFHDSSGPCRGHLGLFQPGTAQWRIEMCTTLDFVYEHELAHAWERANLDDATRRRFMEHRGLEVWNDRTRKWADRGTERAAFAIQQGLAGLPLPSALSAETHARLAEFSILTGRPAPRLLRWIGLDAGHQPPAGPGP